MFLCYFVYASTHSICLLTPQIKTHLPKKPKIPQLNIPRHLQIQGTGSHYPYEIAAPKNRKHPIRLQQQQILDLGENLIFHLLHLQYSFNRNKLNSQQLNLISIMPQAVKVMVRCRPMNHKQLERGCVSVVEADSVNKQINLLKEENKQQPKSFSFDYVFGADCAQSLIYEQSAFSLVDNVLDGYNGTIFAYGQTGCGKTHTMMGTNESEESKGIIPRTFSQIITITKNDTAKTHLIRCSFIEIYNEEIHDLLSRDAKAKMDLKESPEKGLFVKDLLQLQVNSIAKMEEYMEIGFKGRAVRATNMNAESSRSHSIFTIYIDSQQNDQKGNQKYKASKLNLVDLAGSQRASKTGATGEGMKEATKINLSLSALGNVISALVDGKTHHIPYRDSKLTRLLQDSLGGNTKTIMIAAVSPANYNYDETLSTLRYASRAKFIQNKPKINEDPKDALLRQYMDQIKQLKMMLEGKTPFDLAPLASLPAPPKSPPASANSIQTSSNSIQQKAVTRERENKQNTELEQKLKSKEDELKNEQEEKKLLQEKLSSLQRHFEQKGPDKSEEKELQKMKKLKEKLRVQKKKEEEYIRQKERREEELLSIEKNYKSLNEEVDQMKKRFKDIKAKYTSNLQDIKDLQNEHEDEKEELLDTIRYQQKEIKKFTGILSILMTQEQLDYIVNNSEWNEERKDWTVPYFTYKEKNMGLPKLATTGMSKRDSTDGDRDKKEVVFKHTAKEQDKSATDTGFKVNNILKNAREENDSTLVPATSAKQFNITNKAQLTPLKIDSYEKVRAEVGYQAANNDKKKKMEKLNPIVDHRRNV